MENKKRIEKEAIVIRFAGDSGDGIQTIGTQMSLTSAVSKNDVHTFSDFPSDIRSPVGSLYGVSAFQLCFSSKKVFSIGDQIDALVALNPAALKTNITDLLDGGLLIVDPDKFGENDLEKAKYEKNPLITNELDNYKLIKAPITKLTMASLENLGLPVNFAKKCKNFFALGMIYFIYDKPLNTTITWVKSKFSDQKIQEANIKALKAGYNYAETQELLPEVYFVKKAKLEKGNYRQVTGNQAFSFGILTASYLARTSVFFGSYPITPASEIMQDLAAYKDINVMTFQAEDEIAAIGAAIGASFGGKLAITSTSGPGLDLKTEAIGLACMVELPLVIIDVQRAGPSTGMPTKMEQSDLLLSVYGRHGEAPVVVMAAKSPSDCFDLVIEAFRISVKHMTPVILLSDSSIANSSEPWLMPDLDKLPKIKLNFVDNQSDSNQYYPYKRSEDLYVRNWAIPGMHGKEHVIGGLEKEDIFGAVSYDPENHQKMCEIRQKKIEKIAETFPKIEIIGNDKAKLLVISWGTTYGVVRSAVESLQKKNISVSMIHLRYLNPLPFDLDEITSKFEKILVPENNLGQLSKILSMQLVRKIESFNKITGRPFKKFEIEEKILMCVM